MIMPDHKLLNKYQLVGVKIEGIVRPARRLDLIPIKNLWDMLCWVLQEKYNLLNTLADIR